MSRSIARRASASSNASRSGTVPSVASGAARRRRTPGPCRRRRRAAAPSIRSSSVSGSRDRGRIGRQHQRDPAGALHRVDVVAREQHRLLVPDAPARALERGAQADDRWGGHGIQDDARPAGGEPERLARRRGSAPRRLVGLDADALAGELDVAHRAGERVPRADEPPDADGEDQPADGERRVVDRVPVELVVPRHAGRA